MICISINQSVLIGIALNHMQRCLRELNKLIEKEKKTSAFGNVNNKVVTQLQNNTKKHKWIDVKWLISAIPGKLLYFILWMSSLTANTVVSKTRKCIVGKKCCSFLQVSPVVVVRKATFQCCVDEKVLLSFIHKKMSSTKRENTNKETISGLARNFRTSLHTLHFHTQSTTRRDFCVFYSVNLSVWILATLEEIPVKENEENTVLCSSPGQTTDSLCSLFTKSGMQSGDESQIPGEDVAW